MLLLITAVLAGETDKPASTIKMGGLVFSHYGYSLTEGDDGYNEFALDRAYLTATATMTPQLGMRLTLDADRFKASELADGSELTVDTKYRVFLKHAYLEWKDEASGIKSRFGMIDTAYGPFYDSFVGLRYLKDNFPSANKLLSTADLGVGLSGNHASGLLDWQALVINGEGYSNLEVDAGKALQARITVNPLAPGKKMSLPLTGFVSYSGSPSTGAPVITYIGSAGFKQNYLVAWAEYLGVTTNGASASGYSMVLSPRMPDVAGVVFRYDHFDPSTAATGDSTTTLIGGVTHDFYEKVSAAVTYERTGFEATPDTPEHGVFVRMQAGF